MNPKHKIRKYYRCTIFRKIMYIFFIVLTLQLIDCASNDSISGTGSQAGNGRITCTVFNSDGSPASGAKVYLRSHDYIADSDSIPERINSSYRNTRTDTHGNFSIDALDTGRYCIEVNDGKSNAVLISIALNENENRKDLPSDTLYPTGSIKGSFSSKPDDSVVIFVRICGLERIGIFDTITDSFTLNDIPRGNFTIRIQSSSTDFKPVEIEHVEITSNKSTDIGSIDFVHLSQWQYSKRLYLNTSFSGADVSESVLNFPVLVHLTKSEFYFNQAKNDGSDIRFTKCDGTALSYHIEKWENDSQTADVWVKVDTVYGNNNSQYINMYWGNPDASDNSNSWAVFDTADGFQGVWHLGENSETILDATLNPLNGLKYGNQARTDGVIGSGQYFDGVGDYTDLGNVCNIDSFDFTVCTWVKKTGTNKIQTIISKSNGGAANPSYGWLLQLDSDGALSIFMATDTGDWGAAGTFVLTSNIWIVDSSWHHVAVVIDRSDCGKCRLYIDGADVSTLPTGGDIIKIGKVTNLSSLRFGSDAKGGYQWEGSLDECWITYKVHSPGYIKLAYMNQKRDDTLISFTGQ